MEEISEAFGESFSIANKLTRNRFSKKSFRYTSLQQFSRKLKEINVNVNVEFIFTQTY